MVALFRGDSVVETLLFCLILTVAAIPVALPAVMSVTMAVGASLLARMKAIVSRLVSIEEMAGMDMLCSDKTGTLTKNELTLGDPVLFEGDAAALLRAAALTCERDGPDAIDTAILKGVDANVLRRRRDRELHALRSGAQARRGGDPRRRRAITRSPRARRRRSSNWSAATTRWRRA